MITVVQKEFNAHGTILKFGQIVNSTEWRNEQALIAQRYLRPADADEIAKFKKKSGASAEEMAAAQAPGAPTGGQTVNGSTPKHPKGPRAGKKAAAAAK